MDAPTSGSPISDPSKQPEARRKLLAGQAPFIDGLAQWLGAVRSPSPAP